MRCCAATLHDHQEALGDETTGTIVQCKYAPDDPVHRLIARDDGWHWLNPEDDDAPRS